MKGVILFRKTKPKPYRFSRKVADYTSRNEMDFSQGMRKDSRICTGGFREEIVWAGRSETHLMQRVRPGQKGEVRECTHGELGTGGQLGRKEAAGLEYRIWAGKQKGKETCCSVTFCDLFAFP